MFLSQSGYNISLIEFKKGKILLASRESDPYHGAWICSQLAVPQTLKELQTFFLEAGSGVHQADLKPST